MMKAATALSLAAALGTMGESSVQGAGNALTNIVSYKPFVGLSYSPFQGSESPNYGSYPTLPQITNDIASNIVYLASEIMTYGMDGTLSNIPAICNTYGVKCYPCAYISAGNLSDTTSELNTLIAIGNQKYPTTRGLVVGSESILQNYSPQTLINNINYVRAQTHTNVPVGTRDLPSNLINNPSVVSACDFVMIDVYAYWAQIPIANAASWTLQQYQTFTNDFPGKTVLFGEIGWPTDGTNNLWSNASIVPSLANQQKFISDMMGLANSDHIEYGFFSLRDEPWKVQEGVGTVEQHWGLLDTNGIKKAGLSNFLVSGFTIKPISSKTNHTQLLVHTFEGNPYTILGKTNLTGKIWTPNLTFTAALRTNQTLVTVTNSSTQKNGFYEAEQNF